MNQAVVAATSPHTNYLNVRKHFIGRTVQPFIIANVHGANHTPGNYACAIRSLGHQKRANADTMRYSVGTSLSRNERAHYHYDPKCPSHYQHVARVQVVYHDMKAPGPQVPTTGFHAVDLFKTNLSSMAHEPPRLANCRSAVGTALPCTNNTHQLLNAPTPSIALSSADFVRYPVLPAPPCIDNYAPDPRAYEIGRPSALRVNAKVFVSQRGPLPSRSQTPVHKDADVVEIAMQMSSVAFLSAVAAAGAARAASAAVRDLAHAHHHWHAAVAQLQASPMFMAYPSPVADSKKKGLGTSRLPFESTTKSMLKRSYALKASKGESSNADLQQKASTYNCSNQNSQLKFSEKKKAVAHKQCKPESKQTKRGSTSIDTFGPRAQPSPAEIEKAIAKACVLACTVEYDVQGEK